MPKKLKNLFFFNIILLNLFFFKDIINKNLCKNIKAQSIYLAIQKDLLYNLNSLEPYISEEIMDLHYNKHHLNYIKNLNEILRNNSNLKIKDFNYLIENLEKLPENIKQYVKNNLGGHLNHEFFWNMLSPNSSNMKFSEEFINVINSNFGSYNNFINLFKEECNKFFGSGWVFLCLDLENNLKIIPFSNQDSPFFYSLKPIIGIDLWEHTYYLQYKNKRSEFIEIFLTKLLNKNYISELFSISILMDLNNKKINNNEFLLINVLDKKYYDDAHIDKSINVPYTEAEEYLQSLENKNIKLIFYCANYRCTVSDDIAEMALKMKFKNVYVYKGGINEWYQESQKHNNFKYIGNAKLEYLKEVHKKPEFKNNMKGNLKIISLNELERLINN